MNINIFKSLLRISLVFILGVSLIFLMEIDKSYTSAETITDTRPPAVISVETDKETYEAGENIEVTVITRDDNNIEWVDFSFFYGSAKTILLTGNTTDTEKYDDGFFKSVINITIPERTPTTTYNFGTIVVSDGVNETFMGEPNRFFEKTINIVNENNEILDITGPNLVSLETDKTTYLAGEQIKVTIISEEETDVTSAMVALYNNEGNSDLFLYGDVSESTRLSHELFETTVYVDIPIRIKEDGYYINNISLSDGLYETHFNKGGPQKFNVPINIENSHAVDTMGPKLLLVQTDKTTYQPGETIVLSVIAEDETGIDSSQVSFYNDNQDNGRNYLHGDSEDFVSLGNGEFKSTIHIQIPNDIEDTTFRLGSIELLDSLYYTYFSNWRFDFDLSINISSKENLIIPDYTDNEETLVDPTPEESEIEEPVVDSTPEESETEEPVVDPTPEESETVEPVVDSALEESAAEETDYEKSKSENPEEELENNQAIVSSNNEKSIPGQSSSTFEKESNSIKDTNNPLITVNPVTPKDEVITGITTPESTGTISLPNGKELAIESDSEGNWALEIPADSYLASGDEIAVAFENKETGFVNESTIAVKNSGTESEAYEESTMETLPNTGETQGDSVIIAATIAFLGGVLLFITGRRKISKN